MACLAQTLTMRSCRDPKASNVILSELSVYEPDHEVNLDLFKNCIYCKSEFNFKMADFECSGGGGGYQIQRATEV